MKNHISPQVSNIQKKEKRNGVSLVPPVVQRKENKTGLPDNLKSGVESLSGIDMSDVKVHYNSSQPAQLNAHAYAQGNQIHIAPGQQKHLPHEAWHVVQQKQGRVRPTMQMKGKVNINDDKGLEKEADVMGQNANTGVHQMSPEHGTTLLSKSTNAFATTQCQEVVQLVTIGSFKDWLSNFNAFKGLQHEGITLRPEDIETLISRLNAYEKNLASKNDPFDKGKEMQTFLADKSNDIKTLLAVAQMEDLGARGYGASLDDMRVLKNQNTESSAIDPQLLMNLKIVRQFLSNNEAVTGCLHYLDQQIGHATAQPVSSAATAAQPAKPTALQGYNSVASAIENAKGYGPVGEILVEAGVDDGAKLVRSFASKGQPFIDYGVSSSHGAQTHRIQQLILNIAFERGMLPLKGFTPLEIYRHLGRTDIAAYDKRIASQHSIARKADAGARKKLYIWELVLDRFEGKSGVTLIDEETGRDITGGNKFDAGIPISLQNHMTSKVGGGGGYTYPHLASALKESQGIQDTRLRVLAERERLQELWAWRRTMLRKWVLPLMTLILVILNRRRIMNVIRWLWRFRH